MQCPNGYVTNSNRQIGNGLRIGHWSQFFKCGDEMLSETHLQLLLFCPRPIQMHFVTGSADKSHPLVLVPLVSNVS